MKFVRLVLVVVVFCCSALAQTYYTYIGSTNSDSVLIAWGTTDGDNTIGRSSPSKGEATVGIDGRTPTTHQNWMVVGGLKPDTEYPYKVSLAGKQIDAGTVRTWPAASDRLVFFVIGDFGNGSHQQYAIADAMWKEFQRRSAAHDPVRFVLTLGDDIYGDLKTFIFGFRHTGDSDSDWATKFFQPYENLLKQIPFYPTLGNHDGNETEHRGDLTTYLDNFFFPGDKPARWYEFQYANLAHFFALDSTRNTESGSPRAAYSPEGPQFRWMRQVIPAANTPWKIAYYHHPVFNAGPRHAAAYQDLKHWVDLFAESGMQVVFNGHEHNFQFSKVNPRSGGVQFVTSGAGGELRKGDVRGSMDKANIEGWAAENNFLVVEIQGKTMHITPVGFEQIVVKNASGGEIPMPLVVTAK